MLIVDSHRCWELRGFFRTTSGRTVAKHATSVFFFANISKNTKQTGNWLATPKSENSQAKSPKSPKKRCHGDRHWTSWHGQFAGHFGLWHSAREGRSTARLLGTCLVRGQLSNWGPKIRWMGQRNPAPVENGGKHPIICRVSTILSVQDFAGPSAHPQDFDIFDPTDPTGWSGNRSCLAQGPWPSNQKRKQMKTAASAISPRKWVEIHQQNHYEYGNVKMHSSSPDPLVSWLTKPHE